MTPDQKNPELFELLMPDEIYLSWPAWRDYGVLNAHLVPELLDNPVKYIRADLVSKPEPEEIPGLEKAIEHAEQCLEFCKTPDEWASERLLQAARRYASQSRAGKAEPDLLPSAGDVGHDPEWFYRWVARAKAGYAGMSFEQCIDIIWHCPSNPFKENNPWEIRSHLSTPEKEGG